MYVCCWSLLMPPSKFSRPRVVAASNRALKKISLRQDLEEVSICTYVHVYQLALNLPEALQLRAMFQFFNYSLSMTNTFQIITHTG